MKIAFTSCMDREAFYAQPVWKHIEAEAPDYLFLLGDQIYMDFFPHLGEPEDWDIVKFASTMQQKYLAQWAEPDFEKLCSDLRKRQDDTGGVYGTWDDHDFAWNNACGLKVEQDKKDVSRRMFCQFMGLHPEPPAGIHHAVDLKHEGAKIGRAIFLDTRWYRDEAGDDRDLLGEEQFAFLANELQNSEGLTLLCAGTPIHAAGNGWMRYQRDYRRFVELIGDRKIIFLSGDIHENSFVPPFGNTKFFEIIASGAAVKKYKIFGKRQNYGILDWSPAHTTIKLVDRRGSQSYRIDNASFNYEELEATQSPSKD